MRRGGRILVILGLFLGAITAVGTFVVLSTSVEQSARIPTKPVVVALLPIGDRTIIAAEAVGLKEWPEPLPPGELFDKTDLVIGKLAIQPIYPGQIILPPMIVDKNKAGEIGTRSIASILIPEGKVAFSFSAGDGVAGALQPGDYIDLLLTLQSGSLPPTVQRAGAQPAATTGTEGLPVTQIMLQDVLILQVGPWTSTGEKAQATGVLTLALDRQDALALKSAREQGQFDVALRRAGDHAKFDNLEPVTLQYLNKRFKFNLTPPSTGTAGR